MADKPRVPGEDANAKAASESSQGSKSAHDALFAKMDALVGRQRAEASNDADEIPLLTKIVAPAVNGDSPASPNAPDLIALMQPRLIAALTQRLSESLQPQLEAQIANAVRDVLAREIELLAQGIAANVGELMQEHLNVKR